MMRWTAWPEARDHAIFSVLFYFLLFLIDIEILFLLIIRRRGHKSSDLIKENDVTVTGVRSSQLKRMSIYTPTSLPTHM